MKLLAFLRVLNIASTLVFQTNEDESCPFCVADTQPCNSSCPEENFKELLPSHLQKRSNPTRELLLLQDGAKFYLFQNKSEKTEMKIDQPISLTEFIANASTKIIVHGWRNSVKDNMPQFIKDAFLDLYANSKTDVNVIVVDWSYASNSHYTTAVKSCYDVALQIRYFILGLSKQGVSVSDFHFLGHSLGGQIVGLVGRNFKNSPIQFKYFTIMDPAKQCWNKDNVNKDDAKYVEVIHTNTNCFGKEIPSGHVDFYVNYGLKQPGCILSLTCSHSRAYEYIAESILNYQHSGVNFIGTKCTNDFSTIKNRICIEKDPAYYLQMGGLSAKLNERGLYYVETKNKYPYSTGEIPRPVGWRR